MKYECCACKNRFPVEAAVDGFKQGYRVGFLCPLCGANLIEGPREVRQGRGFFIAVKTFAFIGVLAMFLSHFTEGMASEYVLAFLAAYILAYVYGYKKYPSEYGVIGTASGPGKKHGGAGV